MKGPFSLASLTITVVRAGYRQHPSANSRGLFELSGETHAKQFYVPGLRGGSLLSEGCSSAPVATLPSSGNLRRGGSGTSRTFQSLSGAAPPSTCGEKDFKAPSGCPALNLRGPMVVRTTARFQLLEPPDFPLSVPAWSGQARTLRPEWTTDRRSGRAVRESQRQPPGRKRNRGGRWSEGTQAPELLRGRPHLGGRPEDVVFRKLPLVASPPPGSALGQETQPSANSRSRNRYS